MAKIDIINPLSGKEMQVLDIQQLQILTMFDKLLNDDNVLKFLGALSSRGYIITIDEKDGKYRFIGCDDAYKKKRFEDFGMNIDIHSQFEYGVILICKRLLTFWHLDRSIRIEPRYRGLKEIRAEEIVYTGLTRKQRGVLTKILKIENKRKKFKSLKRM